MFRYLVLLFIIVPIIEIYLLLVVGKIVGLWMTLGLIILTAIIGSHLLRAQGLATLHKLQATLARGESPAKPMLEGVFLLIGGVLLLTPGFFTDAVGLICLIPPLRQGLVLWLSRYVQVVHAPTYNTNNESSSQQQPPRHNTTIEGEYRHEK